MSDPTIPRVLTALCDDAAVFPPGLSPLRHAVELYRARTATWQAALAGPLVLPGTAVRSLAPLLSWSEQPLPVSLTFPDGPRALPSVLEAASELPVDLRSIEVTIPVHMSPEELLDQLGGSLAGTGGLDVYVEVPRDERRLPVVQAISGRYRAKFRTGGERADLYPAETELAAALSAVVAAELPFKATAGLHHAVRNTDPVTGFQQHGFLNLLLATDALAQGRSDREAAQLLAERNGVIVANLLSELNDERARRVRSLFVSFGTCSISEPVADLIAFGVIRTTEEVA